MLFKLLLFIIISTLLPACSWFSRSTGSTAGEEIAKPMELLNAEQFQPQDTNNPPSVALFLELPADIREHLDQNILPLETEGQRYNALRDWAFAEFHEDYEYDPYFTSSLSELGRSGRVNCFSF